MNGFVEWLVARQFRLALVAAALVLVAVMNPLLSPLSLLGQAVVALAVLTRGPADGIAVAVLATLMLVLPQLFGGQPEVMTVVAVAHWLPALALAVLLERSRSLSLVAQAATVVIAATVALVFLLGGPVSFWQDLLSTQIEAQGAQVAPAVVDEASRIATGLLGGVTLLTSLGAVFIARWWQASIREPGAFGREFRALRMGVVVGVVTGLVFVAAGLTRLTVLENLTLVLVTGFLLQGLAVTHVIAAVSGSFWLVAVYVLLIVAMPAAVPAVAGLGFVDNWFDLKSRLLRR